MRLSVFVEPQLGAGYEDQLRIARLAQDCGFDGFFRSDHYLTMGGDGLPGPTDAWLTLAALARETSRIRLGTLVTCATFRHPGPLAISVAQVDRMSGGRVELGLGAGWYEAEHTAYGVPFPPVAERFDRLAEQLEIVTGLWATPPGELYGFQGRHYRLTGSPALPKPVQVPGPHVIVGGSGPRRTPALAARFADEYNAAFGSVAETRTRYANVLAACEAIGRPVPAPGTRSAVDAPAAGSGSAPARKVPLVLSIALPVCCGRTDADLRRRSERMGGLPDGLRESALFGTPAEIVDRLGSYAEIGASRAHLQFIDMTDLDHVELVAAEVTPQLAG